MHLELVLRQNGWYTDAKKHICPVCRKAASDDSRLFIEHGIDRERSSLEGACDNRDTDSNTSSM